jgi:hypothetical protein
MWYNYRAQVSRRCDGYAGHATGHRRFRMKWIASALIVAATAVALVSCSSSGSGPSDPNDTTPPTVGGWNLAEDATDVGLIKQIALTFSEDMDASTISDSTVYVEGRALGGYVEYDEDSRTATFTPDTLYASEAWYDVTVDGPTDEAGNPLDPVTRSFQTGTLDCEHLQDYLEPNESYLSPAVVGLNRTYRTLAACGPDKDYYSFTLDQPAKVTVKTHFVQADSLSYYVQLLREDGKQYVYFVSGQSTGDDRGIPFSFNPGTYIASIEDYHHDGYFLYDLEFETSAPCDDDDYEDNDFVDEAEPLSVGETHELVGCYLDADVFSFHADIGQTITLSSTQLTSPYNIGRLTVYRPNGNELGSESGYAVDHTLEVTAIESGTHYAAAMFWGQRTEYEFRIDVE